MSDTTEHDRYNNMPCSPVLAYQASAIAIARWAGPT